MEELAPRESRSTLLGRLSIVVLGLALVGCTPSQSTADRHSISWGNIEHEIAEVSRVVACQETYYFDGDPYYFEPMRGLGCADGSETPFHFRVYSTNDGSDQVLGEWSSLFNDEYTFLRGANWFAVGSPSRLAEVADHLGVPQYSIGASLPKPRTLSAPEDQLNFCFAQISSNVELALVYGEANDDEGIELLFPEITDVTIEIRDAVARDLDGNRSSLPVLSELSTHWQEIDAFCTSTVGQLR